MRGAGQLFAVFVRVSNYYYRPARTLAEITSFAGTVVGAAIWPVE